MDATEIKVPTVFNVSDARLSHVKARIAKLSKRAAKLSLPPIELHIGEPFFKTTKHEITGFVTKHKLYPVTVTGPEPKVPGFDFIARIEHGEGGNLIMAREGAPDLTAYRTTGPNCEHCGTNRRRLVTFVVRETATGALKHVGSDCLADFTGHGSPETALFLASLHGLISDAFEDSESFGSGGNKYLDLAEFLTVAAWSIRTRGWHPKAADFPTSEAVLNVLYGTGETARKEREEYHAALAENPGFVETAEAAIEWARAIDANASNDYLWNLKVLASKDAIDPWRHKGLAAALMKSYLKAEAERIERAAKPASFHVGEVGKREVFTVTIERLFGFESIYGNGTCFMFRTAEGAVLKWWGSGEATRAIEKAGENGASFTIKATVKKHGDWKGSPETTVNRCALFVPKVKKAKKAEGVPA